MTNPADGGVAPRDAPEPAWFRVDEADGCAVVTAGGEIDLYTSPGLRNALAAAATLSPRIVIDLTEVAFLDSSGLGVLVRARSHARARHGSVVLVRPPSMVSKVLHATGLDELFTIHARVEDAVGGSSGTGG
jgi:anti-sigma B factor antagonist